MLIKLIKNNKRAFTIATNARKMVKVSGLLKLEKEIKNNLNYENKKIKHVIDLYSIFHLNLSYSSIEKSDRKSY